MTVPDAGSLSGSGETGPDIDNADNEVIIQGCPTHLKATNLLNYGGAYVTRLDIVSRVVGCPLSWSHLNTWRTLNSSSVGPTLCTQSADLVYDDEDTWPADSAVAKEPRGERIIAQASAYLMLMQLIEGSVAVWQVPPSSLARLWSGMVREF